MGLRRTHEVHRRALVLRPLPELAVLPGPVDHLTHLLHGAVLLLVVHHPFPLLLHGGQVLGEAADLLQPLPVDPGQIRRIVDDVRNNDHQKVLLLRLLHRLTEEDTHQRDVPQERHLVDTFRLGVPNEAADDHRLLVAHHHRVGHFPFRCGGSQFTVDALDVLDGLVDFQPHEVGLVDVGGDLQGQVHVDTLYHAHAAEPTQHAGEPAHAAHAAVTGRAATPAHATHATQATKAGHRPQAAQATHGRRAVGNLLTYLDLRLLVVGGQNVRRGENVDVGVGCDGLQKEAERRDGKVSGQAFASRAAGGDVHQRTLHTGGQAALHQLLHVQARNAQAPEPHENRHRLTVHVGGGSRTAGKTELALLVGADLHDERFHVDLLAADIQLLDYPLQALEVFEGSLDNERVGLLVRRDLHFALEQARHAGRAAAFARTPAFLARRLAAG